MSLSDETSAAQLTALHPPGSGDDTSSGKVIGIVAAHLEPVTRFDASDLSESEPEQVLGVALTLTQEQQVEFKAHQLDGRARLREGVEKLADSEAFQTELQRRLSTAVAQAPEAMNQWGEVSEGSYRRLMPGSAAFLRQPGTIGYEHECNTCAGKCEVICSSCGGAGTRICSGCSGIGRVTCYSCYGSRKHRCTGCAGQGQTSTQVSSQHLDHNNNWVTTYRTEYRHCYLCSGTGSTSCLVCGFDGKIVCGGCGGRGRVNCGTCATTGWVDCVECNASGIQHVFGTIEADVTNCESLEIDSDDQKLVTLVRKKLKLEELPSLGQLLDVQHTVLDRRLLSAHHLRLDVRRASITAKDEAFVIHGFGPDCKVLSFENMAGRLLQDDLNALEQKITEGNKWRPRRNRDLLDTTAEFLRSELHMLIAERVSEISSSSNKAAEEVTGQFQNLVDTAYVARATTALQAALARLYGAEIFEPTMYLAGSAGVVAAGLFAFEWPGAGPASALAMTGVLALAGWAITEAITRRRISKHFSNGFGPRVISQLLANGSIRRWRIMAAAASTVAAATMVFGSQYLSSPNRPSSSSQSTASTAQQLVTWDRQGPDLSLRTYPGRIGLDEEITRGNERARLVLAWQLLLGANKASKDINTAAQILQYPFSQTIRNDPLWSTAKAVLILNQEATPDALRGALRQLDQAAERGFVEARYWQARVLIAQHSPLFNARQGLVLLQQAADGKHAHAALTLGELLATGKLGQQDKPLARNYLEQARKAGLPEAKTALEKLH